MFAARKILTRLFKVSRSFKLVKLWDRFQESQALHPAYTRLMGLLFKVIMLGHVLACLWHYIPLIEDGRDNWFTSYGIDEHTGAFSTKYTASLYWAVATLTGVGYGDIHATTTSERVMSIFATILGSTVFGFIIGNIGSIMDSVDVRGSRRIRRTD